MAALVVAIVGLAFSPARGQSPASPEEQARHHHERGTTFYNLGQFEEAISEYRRGYEQKAHPVFLYNIGQAYRQLGAYDKAVFFYRRYLSVHPEASNRPQVEERIAELEPLVSPEARTRLAPSPEPLIALPPEPRPDLAVTPGPAPRPAPGPVWQRWWFWAGVGGAVAAGVVGALVLSSGKKGPPTTDLGTARFF